MKNYQKTYDDYWSRPDRVGQSSNNMSELADVVVRLFGVEKTLDVGSGEGVLVKELVRRGCEAIGVDVSPVVVERSVSRHSERYLVGSILDLPFPDDFFHNVVSTDCLEHIAPQDVPTALAELHRVTSRNVLLQVATTADRDDRWHLTIEDRAWWESQCLEAGFIKHPSYYRLNNYEALNNDDWQIYIPLQKVPQPITSEYPLSFLEAERGLHMDMLRAGGERSDAHVIRYDTASRYIKSGDRVLDAACGLGYGSYVVRNLTNAEKIVGIDGSERCISYAEKVYGEPNKIEYKCGYLPDALSGYEDASFDVIISFETLEHVENPVALIDEFHRILTPGGRLLVSVPNDWSDETGRDPNPYHLHVYDWARLNSELGKDFILEDAYAQTASRCKVGKKGNTWEKRKRALMPVEFSEDPPTDCEWWVMSAMKSPLTEGIPYVERFFANSAVTSHPSLLYAEAFKHPWLMHAMVNSEYRLRNTKALRTLAEQAMSVSPTPSNDYAAALCVIAYQLLLEGDRDEKNSILSAIKKTVTSLSEKPNGTSLRWLVSLTFVRARLLESVGELDEAADVYSECSRYDIRDFGVHLATKTTEAAFRAGLLRYSAGNPEAALASWQHGCIQGTSLLAWKVEDILINPCFPNLFHHGDGVREYTLCWDNIAKCANGVHLLKRGGTIDFSALMASFVNDYEVVTLNLLRASEYLNDAHSDLSDTREQLHRAYGELIDTRRDLVDRTVRLEQISAQHETLMRNDSSLKSTSFQPVGASLYTATVDVLSQAGLFLTVSMTSFASRLPIMPTRRRKKFARSALKYELRFAAARGVLPSRLTRYAATERLRNGASSTVSNEALNQQAVKLDGTCGEADRQVLVISRHAPTTRHAGGLRILDILKEIKTLSPNTYVELFTSDEPDLYGPLSEVSPFVDQLVTTTGHDFSLERYCEITPHLRQFDVVDFQYPQSPDLIASYRQIGQKLIFTPMESHIRNECLARGAQNLSFKDLKHYPALEEAAICQLVDLTVCVSEADREAITACVPISAVTIETCVSEIEFSADVVPMDYNNLAVCYVAYFGSETNRISLQWYIAEVHPKVLLAVPNYEFRILGKGDVSDILHKQHVGVRYIGEVDRIAPHIASAAIGIAPALSGSGFRGKINQYAALGRPCVATSLAAASLAYSDGTSIFVGDDAEDFAAKVIELLTDEERRQAMGRAAKEMCMLHYSWRQKRNDIAVAYGI